MNEDIVNAGKGPQPKTDRNEDLKRDYLAGLDTATLVAKYGVTPKRIYDILHKLGITPARYQKKSKKLKK